ncbi:hypothetical protein [Actinoplanes utahensis]|nr:hypothetical protein [Actinoplanes utahensis]GIF31524.1 hypothetical protein Aut01nite_45100 [Actinoplanes utahensis]
MIEEVAGILAGQDFGTWSRADIERIAGAAGWSVQDGDYRLTIETGGPARVWSTKLSYGQDGFGYGEQTDLEITETCPADQLPALHTATLAAVTAVLGPPALVGGPHAFSFWRKPRVWLERDLRYRSVTLLVQPADPAENEEYSNAEYAEGWRPRHLWNAEPDVQSDAAGSLGGMMLYDGPEATTFDEFATGLRRLFMSFATDLTTLADYVPGVGWEIRPVDKSVNEEISGWFDEASINLQKIRFGTTDAEHIKLPLGAENGARAAETILGWVRGWAVTEPAAQLRHHCYVRPPVRLWARAGFRIP